MPSRDGLKHAPNPVRRRRLELGLTQAEVCGVTGLSEATIFRVEHGRVRPSRFTRLLLASALAAKADDLFPEDAEGGSDGRRPTRPR